MARKSFSQKLLTWYDRNKRDLPWRKTKDPYKIWISEVMLQQTTVATVIPHFNRWFKKFPTVQRLAAASIQSVLAQWQGLGYYNRARNLHAAAKIICADYEGQLPKTPEQIRKLPGFGPYTTGAVLSIAFDAPLTIIDANVRRVIMRALALPGLAVTKQDEKIEEFLKSVFPKSRAGDFNQSLMELGALVCRSQNPQCIQCPLKDDCRAYKQSKQEIIPAVTKRETKDLHVAVGVFQKGNRYYFQKRASTGILADLWEFPGGKVEPGETHLQALKREMREELAVTVKRAKFIGTFKHFYTQFRVHLHTYLCESATPPAIGARQKWLTLRDVKKYPLPSGSVQIVDFLNKQ